MRNCSTGFRQIDIMKWGLLFCRGLPKPNFTICCQLGSPRHWKMAPQCLTAASGQGLLLGSISPLPQPVETTVAFVAERIRFHKCKHKSYNHTMCSSGILYAVLICSSSFLPGQSFKQKGRVTGSFQTVAKRYHRWSGSAHVLENGSQLKTSFTSQV